MAEFLLLIIFVALLILPKFILNNFSDKTRLSVIGISGIIFLGWLWIWEVNSTNWSYIAIITVLVIAGVMRHYQSYTKGIK